jgi:large conductance mechanosensitive channel
MKILQEFRQFAMKGNVIDMAVGIIIGAAFGKIISSLVNDVLMPPVGMALGGVDFTDLKAVLKPGGVDAAGNTIDAVTINYGVFLQTAIDFLIVAFAIFLLIKAINSLKRKEEAVAPEPTKEEKLLTEIRDLLKK